MRKIKLFRAYLSSHCWTEILVTRQVLKNVTKYRSPIFTEIKNRRPLLIFFKVWYSSKLLVHLEKSPKSRGQNLFTQSLSYMIAVSAAVRFKPRPPARVDKRKMNTFWSELKFSICKKDKTVSGLLEKVLFAQLMWTNNYRFSGYRSIWPLCSAGGFLICIYIGKKTTYLRLSTS